MNVTIDPADPTPPFAQLRSQLQDSIASGALASGTRLPTIRQLAADLGLAPGTVARAYGELEVAELIETNRSKGTRVREVPEVRRVVHDAADAYIATARAHGIEPATAIAIVRARYETRAETAPVRRSPGSAPATA